MDYVSIYRIRDFKIKIFSLEIMKKYNKKYVPAHYETMQTTRFAKHILGNDTLLDINLCVRFKVLVRRQMF